MRRTFAPLLLGTLLVFVVFASASPAWGGSFLAPCVGGGIKSQQDSGNAGGDVLVTWQETREGSDETCASSVADAALGSTSAGFVEIGPVSEPGLLARPTGVFLDGAGDGWILGTHMVFTGFSHYGPTYQDSGAWLAFRGAGRAFGSPVALPAGKAGVEPFIVGDQAGAVVVGWNISSGEGAYLAWGDSSGRLSKPRLFPRLRISSLGMDETGHVVIGAVWVGRGEGRSVLLLSGYAGRFSRPRVLARAPRTPPHQELPSIVTAPLVLVGPSGQAVITWDVVHNPACCEGRHFLTYRYPDGEISKPIRYPYQLFRGEVLPNPGERNTATVDGAGEATIVTERDNRFLIVTIAPGGHPSPPRQLITNNAAGPGGLGRPHLAGDASGQLALAWDHDRSIEYTLGDNLAGFPKPQLITPPSATSNIEPLVTISQNSEATAVWLQVGEPVAREQTIEAQSLTPGATPIPIVVHRPLAH